MKRILFIGLISFITFSCGEDFLEKNPTIGLSADKLTDVASMQALIYGAYGQVRPFVHQPALYSAAMLRDVLNRNRGEYDQFYRHELSPNMTSWMYTAGYQVLGLLNTVAVSDLDAMGASENEKSSILGDMHFLRALVYHELNNYWALPSTGYSVPLLLEPLTVNDRISTSSTNEVLEQIEIDIEMARTHFESASGVANYYAATALAARIYFYQEKYDLAYERANEVIIDGGYSLEGDVSATFEPPGNSGENIFNIKFNSGDGSGVSPSSRIWEAYQASSNRGFYSMNPNAQVAEILMNPDDARFQAFYTQEEPLIFVDGKYSTEQMDYIYIRLAEMYLTRAEAQIRSTSSVSQQDVDDLNAIIARATPGQELVSIPAVADVLDVIYEERTRELAFEIGDRFLNARRLQLPIIQTEQEGGGTIPFTEWNEELVFPFPDIEVEIHGLNRNP